MNYYYESAIHKTLSRNAAPSSPPPPPPPALSFDAKRRQRSATKVNRESIRYCFKYVLLYLLLIADLLYAGRVRPGRS